jgi:hypothetical protein
MSMPSPDKPDKGMAGWLVALLWVVGIAVLLIGICVAIVVTSGP